MGSSGLGAYAAEVVGPHRVRHVHRDTPATVVHEVVDTDGVHWFVKAVRPPRKWRKEMGAYRSWVPALGDRAPRLVHADDDRQAFVTSAVPGRPADPLSPHSHRRAGELLATIHDLDRAVEVDRKAWRAWSRVTRRRTERGLRSCEALGVAVPEAVVRRCLDGIAQLGPLPMVSCHGDYLPKNWLDDDGVLRLIDFGEAMARPRGVAFARLHAGVWWERPDLADAFHEGYASLLTEADRRFVELHRGLSAFFLLRWAAHRGHRDLVRHGQAVLASVARPALSPTRGRAP